MGPADFRLTSGNEPFQFSEFRFTCSIRGRRFEENEVNESNGWTPGEEKLIASIAATETMHDPENATGDRRIPCSRIEAIRRMRTRTRGGVYQAPTGLVKANATLPVTPLRDMTVQRQAKKLRQEAA